MGNRLFKTGLQVSFGNAGLWRRRWQERPILLPDPSNISFALFRYKDLQGLHPIVLRDAAKIHPGTVSFERHIRITLWPRRMIDDLQLREGLEFESGFDHLP